MTVESLERRFLFAYDFVGHLEFENHTFRQGEILEAQYVRSNLGTSDFPPGVEFGFTIALASAPNDSGTGINMLEGLDEDGIFAGETRSTSLHDQYLHRSENYAPVVFATIESTTPPGTYYIGLMLNTEGYKPRESDTSNNLWWSEPIEVIAGSGPITVEGTDRADVISLQGGNVENDEPGLTVTVNGAVRKYKLAGTGLSVLAGGGNDRVGLYGLSGVYVLGGAGNDRLVASNGGSLLSGAGGRDTLIGGIGRDNLYGGSQGDLILGLEGEDLIKGGGGNDRMFGGEGGDTIYGGNGDDVIVANDADGASDFITGQAGNDKIYCLNKKRDTAVGGAGSDFAESDGSPLDVLEGIETTA